MKFIQFYFSFCFLLNSTFSWVTKEVPFDSGHSQLPFILWWNFDFFPHVAPKDENKVLEIECSGNGKKCLVTQNRDLINLIKDRYLSIMFYGTDFHPEDIPLPKKSNHLWSLINEESPQNNYMLCHNATSKVFNISASYKRTSDFPLSTQHFPSLDYLLNRRPVDIVEKNKFRKEGLAPILYLQSHCGVSSDRDRYIQKLMNYIDIDSYGSCLNNKHFENITLGKTSEMHNEELYSIISKYKFHIAFENSICDDYITEKLTRPLHLGCVPIYRGSPSVRDFCPDKTSVILADDFETPEKLAKYLNYLDNNDEAYLKHLNFKTKSEIENKFLYKLLSDRKWSVNGFDEDHFVGAFECYVCQQLHEIIEEKAAGKSVNKLVKKQHLNCPVPSPSYGKIEDRPSNDYIYNWISDYWQHLDLSRALVDMVEDARIKDISSTSVWSYIEKWYKQGEGALQHTEL